MYLRSTGKLNICSIILITKRQDTNEQKDKKGSGSGRGAGEA